MTVEALFLSENERDLLQTMLDWFRNVRTSPLSRGEEGEDHQAPECYIALTPAGGIPGLTDIGTAGGTTDDIPGKATCTIHKIMDTGVPEFSIVTGFSKVVYNLSKRTIPEDTWIVVQRTKYGPWLADAGSDGDGSNDIIAIQLAENHPGRGIRFDVYTGVESGDQWYYDVSVPKPEECIDWRYDVPYPDAGACGFAIRRSDGLLEVIDLDCSSPGDVGT